jgi:hypothetical protein
MISYARITYIKRSKNEVVRSFDHRIIGSEKIDG